MRLRKHRMLYQVYPIPEQVELIRLAMKRNNFNTTLELVEAMYPDYGHGCRHGRINCAIKPAQLGRLLNGKLKGLSGRGWLRFSNDLLKLL